MAHVTSTPNGWHHTTVTTTDRATGMPYDWSVRWRTQRAVCEHTGRPDLDTVAVWDAENLPYLDGDGRGGLLRSWAQCGRCGRMFSADFSAVER